MTSLNAPGFSLTLLNLTHISKIVSSVDELLAFVDAPHASAAWPSTNVYPVPPQLAKRAREEKFVDIPADHKLAQVGGPTLNGMREVFFYLPLINGCQSLPRYL
jgi:dihydroxyacetone kinase